MMDAASLADSEMAFQITVDEMAKSRFGIKRKTSAKLLQIDRNNDSHLNDNVVTNISKFCNVYYIVTAETQPPYLAKAAFSNDFQKLKIVWFCSAAKNTSLSMVYGQQSVYLFNTQFLI